MASEIIVQTLKGPTSGANANKVIIPSGQTLDVSAGTVLPSSGQIVQMVTSTIPNSPAVTSTSTTYADTGHSATITPTSTSSTIYIQLLTTVEIAQDLNQALRIKLFRDSTEIFYSSNILYTGAASQDLVGVAYGFTKIDSPSSTSAITYKTQLAMREATSSGQYNKQEAVLVLMEIAG